MQWIPWIKPVHPVASRLSSRVPALCVCEITWIKCARGWCAIVGPGSGPGVSGWELKCMHKTHALPCAHPVAHTQELAHKAPQRPSPIAPQPDPCPHTKDWGRKCIAIKMSIYLVIIALVAVAHCCFAALPSRLCCVHWNLNGINAILLNKQNLISL